MELNNFQRLQCLMILLDCISETEKEYTEKASFNNYKVDHTIAGFALTAVKVWKEIKEEIENG